MTGYGTSIACPDCISGRAIPCAVGCRETEECCDKRLGFPCERCGGLGVLPEPDRFAALQEEKP